MKIIDLQSEILWIYGTIPVSHFIFLTIPTTRLHFLLAPLANPVKPLIVLRLGVTDFRMREERAGDHSLNQ